MVEQALGRALSSRGLKQADVTAASRLIGVDKTQAAHLLVEMIPQYRTPTVGSIIRDARLREVPRWDHCDWSTQLVSNDPEWKKPRMDAAIDVFNHLF